MIVYKTNGESGHCYSLSKSQLEGTSQLAPSDLFVRQNNQQPRFKTSEITRKGGSEIRRDNINFLESSLGLHIKTY